MVAVKIKAFVCSGSSQIFFVCYNRDGLLRRIVILTLRQIRSDLCRSRFQNRHGAVFRNGYHTFSIRQLVLYCRLCMVCRRIESE